MEPMANDTQASLAHLSVGAARRIGIYCDLGQRVGAGHFVRCAALGAALRRRGAQVDIVADFADAPWAATQAAALGLCARHGSTPAAMALLALAQRWDALVVDSYLATSADFEAVAVPMAVIDDDAARVLPARLVVNQNLTATICDYHGWPAPTILRGPQNALLRPQIVDSRPLAYQPRDWTGRPRRVLLVLGGTDAAAGVVNLARLLIAAFEPVSMRVIASTPQARAALDALPMAKGSSMDASLPVLDIDRWMRWADLVVSAAGSTIWELCCVGAPMALVTVAANQNRNYELACDAGLAIGLGRLADVLAGHLDTALRSIDADRANAVGLRAWHTVDGGGADRVADAVLALAATREAISLNEASHG